jgi:hypothetical protein
MKRFLITPKTYDEYDRMVDWLFENTDGKGWTIVTSSIGNREQTAPNTYKTSYTFKDAYMVKFDEDIIDPHALLLFQMKFGDVMV